MTRLSVLDQSPVRRQGTPAEALADTISLAQFADRLGYERYWVAEHHNSTALASTAPEVLIGQIAMQTEHIRVGSGGVMLPHYSALKVAEAFRLLETLYPGRIDLGIGRAPGSDARTARALAPRGVPMDLRDFPNQLLDLYGFLSDDFPPEHEFHGIAAMPRPQAMPTLWLLGSSDVSAGYAADLGWPFCYAHFINSHRADSALDAYRKLFSPSPVSSGPRTSIAVSALVADTQEEAERLSWSRWGWRLMGAEGQGGIPPPEDALAFEYTAPEREYLEVLKRRSIYGDPGQVRDQLLSMGERYGVDDFVVVTITYDFKARMRSYELLAEAFGLKPPS
tara:strand:+ start:835 stop:1845 length:1011 start_codon:yes stop_codon:yes gene_type:complete